MALVKVPHSFSIPQILWRSNRKCWWKCHVWIPKPDFLVVKYHFSFNLPFLGLAYRFLVNFPRQKPRHSIQVVDAHGKAQPKKRLVRRRDWKIRCGLKPMNSRYVWGMNIHKSQLCQLWAEHYWTHSAQNSLMLPDPSTLSTQLWPMAICKNCDLVHHMWLKYT